MPYTSIIRTPNSTNVESVQNFLFFFVSFFIDLKIRKRVKNVKLRERENTQKKERNRPCGEQF